jgi:hypothetical protein
MLQSSLYYCPEDNASSVSSFHHSGLVVVKRDDDCGVLCQGNETVKSILKEYIEAAHSKGGLGLKKEGGYRELVQKDVGRFDLNLDHLIPRPGSVYNRPFTSSEAKMREIFNVIENRIQGVLASILTDQYIVNAFGAVVSYPNTEAQRWHVDVSHLFQTDGSDSSLNALPCHFVTVFCPLFEYSEAIGPTEIALQSKALTSSLSNRTVEDQYPADTEVSEILDSPSVEVIKFQTNIGDIGKNII